MSSKIRNTIKINIPHEYIPIFILLLINIVIGALVVTDYGESWDEHLRYRYAQHSINAYQGIPGDIVDEKGPFFVMIATIGGNLICSLREECLISDARHYINFLSFLMGLFFLYRLNLRFTNKWAAFGGTLLLNTQPLLWGHAFINPKDLPFMAFFIASIDTGFAMADSIRSKIPAERLGLINNSEKSLVVQLNTDLKLISQTKKRILIITSFIIILVIASLFIYQGSVQKGIESLILDIHTNETNSVMETIFAQVAQNIDEIPIENYIQKAWKIYSRAIKYLSLSLFIIWILISSLILSNTREHIISKKIKPFWESIWGNLKNPKVIFAGVFLGLTCSIRTLGPAAGGLISLYLLAKHKKYSIPILVAYGLIGVFTTYISWPGLWNAPLRNYLDSLSIASDFPWDGKVLFSGISYTIDTLPRSYLPILLSIQFTITTLGTVILGFILSIKKSIKKQLDWMKVTVIYLWFFLPFALVIIVKPNIYDNFRHFLFIIPPLFTFAAIGLQGVFDKIKLPAIQLVTIIILILPNIFSLVRLHPYQYIYYNLFTNGVEGAFREYEMDYWGTSYREATEYINKIAPKNSKIIVFGAPHLVEVYAREDLEIEKYKKGTEYDLEIPSFAILLSRYDKDIQIYPEAKIIKIVERDGAVFTVVKDLTNSKSSAP